MTLWQREHMCSLKTTCCFLGDYKRSLLLSFLELKKSQNIICMDVHMVCLYLRKKEKTENLHLLVSMRVFHGYLKQADIPKMLKIFRGILLFWWQNNQPYFPYNRLRIIVCGAKRNYIITNYRKTKLNSPSFVESIY